MKSKILLGQYIAVNILNDYFEHVALMLLEHFDNPKYQDNMFILGVCNFSPASSIKKQFPNKKIIVYQLEQLMGGCANQNLVRSVIQNIKSADEIWDYDPLNIQFLKDLSINVEKFLPMIYTKCLDRIKSLDNPEIDVLFYGWMNPRRFDIFHHLQKDLNNKLNIAWIYGRANVDSYIANSKVILNIHAYQPWNRQEQIRMFYPLINGKTVVSEISQANLLSGEIVECKLEELSNNIIQYCQNDNWKTFGQKAKESFKLRSKSILEKIL